ERVTVADERAGKILHLRGDGPIVVALRGIDAPRPLDELVQVGTIINPGIRRRSGRRSRRPCGVARLARLAHVPPQRIELELRKAIEDGRDMAERAVRTRAPLRDAAELYDRHLEVLGRGVGHREAGRDALVLL